MSWVDYVLGEVLLRRSSDHGATFTPPVVVASVLDNLNATPLGWQDPPGTYIPRVYPHYRAGVRQHAAPNFPALAVDLSERPTRGVLYLVWADHAEGTPAAPTAFHFDIEPNDNPSAAQSVSPECEISGSLWAGGDTGPSDVDWFAFDGVAGRTLVLDGSVSGQYSRTCQLYEELPDGRRLPLAMSILLGSADIASGSHAQPPIVTLPRTGRYLISLAGTSLEAPDYTVRLRTLQVAPGSVARDMRDIVLVRSSDGGATWSGKQRVNHDPAGADQHQPNVAVDGGGNVYVAWYDRRESATGMEVRPYAAVSSDGGLSFGPDLPLGSVSSKWTGLDPQDPGDDGGLLIGDRIALAAGDEFGMAAWTDLRVGPNHADIYASRIVDVTTAVAAVADLSAEPERDAVRLRWRVSEVSGLAALELLRATGEGPEEQLATVAVANGLAEYMDASVEPGVTYRYRLRVRMATGTSYHLGPVAASVPGAIAALAWRSAGPNPFGARAALTLAVPQSGEAVVRVYDVQGKLVRTLHAGRLAEGEQRLEWDGRDASGAEAAPGLYFVAADLGGASVHARLTRVR